MRCVICNLITRSLIMWFSIQCANLYTSWGQSAKRDDLFVLSNADDVFYIWRCVSGTGNILPEERLVVGWAFSQSGRL